MERSYLDLTIKFHDYSSFFTAFDVAIYNLPYIILETKINIQNAVTFVLVKLDTKFNVQNS